LDQFWSLTSQDREIAHPIDFDLEVLFYDPEWQVLHVRDDSIVEFIAPTKELRIRAGDRVKVRGVTNPMPYTFSIGEASWDVVENLHLEGAIIDPGSIDRSEWIDRLVTVEGLVESQELLDAKHLELRLISGGHQVAVWVMLSADEAVPQFLGNIVELTGVYAPKFESNGEVKRIEIFCSGSDRVREIAALQSFDKFKIPATRIDQIRSGLEGGDLVLVEGSRVGAMEHGMFWLRDPTGQIRILSGQRHAPDADAQIQVIGRPEVAGIERTLTQAIWRRTQNLTDDQLESGRGVLLHRLADSVMELSLAQASQGHPVEITGVVTWSQPNGTRMFLQDSSGGVGVEWPLDLGEVPSAGQLIHLQGTTQVGQFAPTIRATSFEDQGSIFFPRPEAISWEQAMMGLAEAQWVKVTGFVYAAQREGGSARLNISTAAGEMVARIASDAEVSKFLGSVVAISGVCVVDADIDRRLSNVELWVPVLDNIEVLDSGDFDQFAMTPTPLEQLDRFDSNRSFNERLRTQGTVLHWDSQGRIYISDGGKGIRVHSRQSQHLRRGDNVIVIGFQGRDANRPIFLREAVYQVIGSTAVEPSPRIAEGEDLSQVIDGSFIQIDGILIELLDSGLETRLSLRNGTEVFEVDVPQDAVDWSTGAPIVGSVLRICGVSLVDLDERGSRTGIRVLASSTDDIKLLSAPSWWSPERVTLVVSLLVGLVLLTLFWVRLLKRRVWMQSIKIEQQMQRASELEADLQRTSRMESMGSLAEGIARDFDDLLDRIKSQTAQVMENERLTLEGRKRLDQARAALLRAKDLTHRLASLSLARKPELEMLDMAMFLRREVDAFEAGPSVKIVWQVEESIPEIPADRSQMREVIYNLLMNAVQAMPPGGTIKIVLNSEQISSEDKESMLPSGAYLRLIVRDSGEGIPASNIERVFDPYFSTRPGAKGLGLSVVYAIVRQHSGRVIIESSPMAGTEVSIWFRVKTDDWSNGPFEVASV
jgi:two-component system, cell cycle sensor histidine kinase and response regulator CckA